jgi:hypothetical protein
MEAYNAMGLALTDKGRLQAWLHERLPRLLRVRRTGPPAPERTPTSELTPCGTSFVSRSSAHLLHVYAPMNFMYAPDVT